MYNSMVRIFSKIGFRSKGFPPVSDPEPEIGSPEWQQAWDDLDQFLANIDEGMSPPENYTPESWQIYEDAKQAATDILNPAEGQSSYSSLIKAYNDLMEAASSLELLPEPDPVPDEMDGEEIDALSDGPYSGTKAIRVILYSDGEPVQLPADYPNYSADGFSITDPVDDIPVVFTGVWVDDSNGDYALVYLLLSGESGTTDGASRLVYDSQIGGLPPEVPSLSGELIHY